MITILKTLQGVSQSPSTDGLYSLRREAGNGLGGKVLSPLYNQISDFQVTVDGKHLESIETKYWCI